MAGRSHHYQVAVEWLGNHGEGTSSYKAYGREHRITAEGKPDLLASADPAFRGERDRWNPEELLVASLSACHQLWYLHLCAVSGVVVTAYRDEVEGEMAESEDGSGAFVRVVLRPKVTVNSASDAGLAEKLHHEANAKCFIARSVNFPVEHEPQIALAD